MKARSVIASFLALVTLAFAANAYAVADNPVAPAEPAPAKGLRDLWNGSAEFSFLQTTGNTQTLSLGAAAEASFKPNEWSYSLRFGFVRNEAFGTVNAFAVTSLLRGARSFSRKLEVFGQASFLRNTFAGFDSRIASEAGLGYFILPEAPHTVRMELGTGFTSEDPVFEGRQSFPTIRIGSLYRWKISENAEFTSDLSFLENIQDFDDWRLTSTSSIAAAMTSRLSLKFSYALNHRNEPITTFKRTDTVTSAAVVAKF